MFTEVIVELSNDATLAADLKAVVDSAVSEFNKVFPMAPPAGLRPIRLFHRPEGPITDSTSNLRYYQIGLSINCRFYDQLVYQLGHELCHIIADPRRTNWLVECCCELASLVLLSQMSTAWALTPPFPNWRSYAPRFKEYAQNQIRGATKAIFGTDSSPGQDQLQKWLMTANHSFKENPIDRQRNTIIAVMLRPFFEESEGNWDALRFLGQSSANPPTALTDLDLNSDFEFSRWEKVVPEELRELVQRINRLFI